MLGALRPPDSQLTLSDLPVEIVQYAAKFLGPKDVTMLAETNTFIRNVVFAHARGASLTHQARAVCSIGHLRVMLEAIARLPASVRDAPLTELARKIPELTTQNGPAARWLLAATLELPPEFQARPLTELARQSRFFLEADRQQGFQLILDAILRLPASQRAAPLSKLAFHTFLLPHAEVADAFDKLLKAGEAVPIKLRFEALRELPQWICRLTEPQRSAAFSKFETALTELPGVPRGKLIIRLYEAMYRFALSEPTLTLRWLAKMQEHLSVSQRAKILAHLACQLGEYAKAVQGEAFEAICTATEQILKTPDEAGERLPAAGQGSLLRALKRGLAEIDDPDERKRAEERFYRLRNCL